jgi:hypothetical protein
MFRPKGHHQVHVHLPASSVVLFTLKIVRREPCRTSKMYIKQVWVGKTCAAVVLN